MVKVFQSVTQYPEHDTDKRVRNEGSDYPGKTLRPYLQPEEMEQPYRKK